MKIKQILPVNSTHGTLIDVYSKGGLKEEALHWLEKMNDREMVPDEVTIGIVVQMYKKAGKFQKAEEFFKKWTLDTYGKAGQLKEAFETFAKILREGDGGAPMPPDTRTYNILIFLHTKHNNITMAASYFKRMKEARLMPNHSALTRMYIEAGMLEKAWLWFRKFHLKGNMSSECYSASVDAYGERGHIFGSRESFHELPRGEDADCFRV
ncbi:PENTATRICOPEPTIDE REPEAT-CONTAINING PROTEIN 1 MITOCHONDRIAL [Salix koriyanagi]|uniref:PENTATRICOPEPTIDE REPEAT-CONTAINING PROTEIN 1 MITOCHONDRIAL n=1 Tax=Salix koriyanagi TaxID=2511006 RepID=A0A9Q0VDI0_9ROSI|nr:PENTATRICOPEPTIDE REPEAT-CONTAINING PROTEIN 1 MITOCHONDRIAL [Salix koriyanagi]